GSLKSNATVTSEAHGAGSHLPRLFSFFLAPASDVSERGEIRTMEMLPRRVSPESKACATIIKILLTQDTRRRRCSRLGAATPARPAAAGRIPAPRAP